MSGTVHLVPSAVAADTSDTHLAVAIRTLLAEGQRAEARELYGDLMATHQRRANRIAYRYLQDAADTDEAVQDAFLKAFSHLASFRDELPFEAWFTRILVNGCLDRLKARNRRTRWFTSLLDLNARERDTVGQLRSREPSPEDRLLGRERRRQIAEALARLPERQRTVFILSECDGCTAREVSAMTGLQEATVRVHLFRAIRKLRSLLDGVATPIHLQQDRVG